MYSGPRENHPGISQSDNSEGKRDSKMKLKRMTIQLSDDLSKHLEWLAQSQGISQVEAIRKAIATESFLQKEVLNGAKVLLQADETVRELVFR